MARLCDTAAVRFIDDDNELNTAIEALRARDVYFIDTEFESNRNGTTLSVLQVSGLSRDELAQPEPTGEIFLLDAVKLTRLSELGPVMIRDGVQWVLHAGLQDVELLLECFRLPKPPSLFDTQVAWALLGPESSVSLAYLQYRMLGVRSMKSHQADNWMRRPLPQSQLQYAADDIRYLPKLYNELNNRLATPKSELVADICAELLWPKPELPPELSLGSFRNAWQLEPNNQAALRFLIRWYNGLPAWERDRAPVPKTLLSIASRLPPTAKDLLRIKGLPPQFSKGYAENLVHGMARAVAAASAGDFVHIEPEPYATFEDIQLDAWLGTMRAEVASACQVSPDLAFPAKLVRSYKEAVVREGRDRLPDLLEGWRKVLLTPAVQTFVEKTNI